MNERAAAFFCPYCGEEDIRPAGETPGTFDCRSCARRWTLRFVGVLGQGELTGG